MMLFLNNAIFRGAGDASIAMRLLWVSNIINLVLDPCLIFGLGPFPKSRCDRRGDGDPHRAQHRGAVPVLIRLLQGTERIHICDAAASAESGSALASAAGFVERDFAVCHRTYELDWAGAHRQHLSARARWRDIRLAIRIVIFVILPSWGFSNAAATLVGQNLGAGKPDRAEQAVWRTGLYNMIFLGASACSLSSLPTPVVQAVHA